MMFWHGLGGFGMGWMWLFGLLTMVALGLLALVIVWAITSGAKRNTLEGGASAAAGGATARRILDERYAKGELTTEEYRERLAVLREGL